MLEQIILENIRRCNKIVGKFFKVIFWHVNLTEQECKDFVKRNEKLLFEVNTKITKKFEPSWFLINTRNANAFTGKEGYKGLKFLQPFSTFQYLRSDLHHLV